MDEVDSSANVCSSCYHFSIQAAVPAPNNNNNVINQFANNFPNAV